MKYKNKASKVFEFRKHWEKKGYELINITSLCKPKLGISGWINDINEPEEEAHFIKFIYRDEEIANICGDGIEIIDDDKYVLFLYNRFPKYEKSDFIIFRKVKKNGK